MSAGTPAPVPDRRRVSDAPLNPDFSYVRDLEASTFAGPLGDRDGNIAISERVAPAGCCWRRRRRLQWRDACEMQGGLFRPGGGLPPYLAGREHEQCIWREFPAGLAVAVRRRTRPTSTGHTATAGRRCWRWKRPKEASTATRIGALSITRRDPERLGLLPAARALEEAFEVRERLDSVQLEVAVRRRLGTQDSAKQVAATRDALGPLGRVWQPAAASTREAGIPSLMGSICSSTPSAGCIRRGERGVLHASVPDERPLLMDAVRRRSAGPANGYRTARV